MAKEIKNFRLDAPKGQVLREVQTAKLDRIKSQKLARERAASNRRSEQGIFNLVTSLSTYIIVMVILVLAGTTTFYSENKESLSWVDENGEFIETSYIRDNNVAITDLNGYSLNEVFDIYNDGGLSSLSKNTSLLNTDIIDDVLYTYNLSTSQYMYLDLNNNNGYSQNEQIYIRVDIKRFTTSTNARLNLVFENPDKNYYPVVSNEWETLDFLGYIDEVPQNVTYDIRLRGKHSIQHEVHWKEFVVINLSDLGINITKDEMNYYYDAFKNNSVNAFNELGSIPVSNYATLGQVITSVVETMDAFLSGWIDFYETILSIF